MRDDPYYIVDDRPPSPAAEDLDSIPVVKLEGMPSLQGKYCPRPWILNANTSIQLPTETIDNRLPSLRALAHPYPAQSFVIEKDGEMPEGALDRPSPPTSHPQTPTPAQSKAPTPLPASSFPHYDEVVDDVTRTSTPDPIKVTRPKKATGKKKRKPVDS